MSNSRGKMIETILFAGLQGLAKSLGQRLVAAPKQAVAIRELTEEVKTLRAEQYRNQAAVSELIANFERVVGRVDGLTIAGSEISFRQTEQSPTLGDVLISLDRRIEELRSSYSAGKTTQGTVVEPTTQRSASILDGLDEEISRLRDSGTGGS